MTLSYTLHLRLAVPDFLTEPWHGEFAAAMDSVDRAIYEALLTQSAALWVNSHVYTVGTLVISPDNGSLYSCAVANTSSPSPTTFTQELVAHPTFWVPFAPALASQAEAEAGVDNTKYMSPLRTKQAFNALITLSAFAPINSPIFTGTPQAPTAAQGTNTTQLATTAFANAAQAGLYVGAGPGAVSILSGHNGYFFGLDATAGNVTVTIDAAANLPAGWKCTFYRVDATANTITVQGTGGQLIDGRTSARLISQGDVATVRKIGTAFITQDAKWKQRTLSLGSATLTILNEIPLGCPSFVIEGWSAGSSGSGSSNTQRGGGGASGCYGKKTFIPSVDATINLAAGTGGAGVAGGGGAIIASNAGGSSSIVAATAGTFTLPGGGATPAGSFAGGIGGIPVGAWDESMFGADGFASEGTATQVGFGGSAPRGGPGAQSNVAATGAVPGGGGSCANHTGGNSGAGANGRFIVSI